MGFSMSVDMIYKTKTLSNNPNSKQGKRIVKLLLASFKEEQLCEKSNFHRALKAQTSSSFLSIEPLFSQSRNMKKSFSALLGVYNLNYSNPTKKKL